MDIKPIYTALLLTTALTASAQRKPANGHKMISMAAVTSRRTLPGRKEMQPVTNYRIIAVWKSRCAPKNFFWLAEDGSWMNCRVALAHKKLTEPEGYAVTPADLSQIHCGDTLELIPVPEKLTKPQHIPGKTINTLFFTAPAGKWWYITAAKISRQPDIIMP